jgi:hypothetical protein
VRAVSCRANMSFRGATLAVSALGLTLCAVAMAAALPKAHTGYFYLKSGKFSVTLTTKSAKQIAAGKARVRVSEVLVVCPRTSTGGTNEVQMGFPGVKLKLSKGHHYGFSITYTEKHADVVTITPVFGRITHEPATATITGTVESSRLIAGTVSVTAAGCSLPKAKYKATPQKKSG